LELDGVGWSDVVRFDGGTAKLGSVGGEKKGLIGGVHVSMTEKRKGAMGEMHKLEQKVPFR
jgi:hypothetical protein